MKVLHTYSGLSPRLGGPIPVIQGLTEHLVKRGVKVTLFATTWNTEGEEGIAPEGVDVRVFRHDRLSRFWAGHSGHLRRALQQMAKDYDLLHVHGPWNYPAYAATRAARLAGKPYIVTVHGTLGTTHLKHKRVKKILYGSLFVKRMLNAAAAVQALTEEEKRSIHRFGVSAPVVTIPNGVSLEDFLDLPSGEVFEQDYPHLQGKIVILYLGRLHPLKGLDLLIKATRLLAIQRKDVHVVIAGPDTEGYRGHLERLRTVMGLRERVTFTGMLTGRRKKAALSRADIFVLPSYAEGFSMALLEAMASGLPVVITPQCHLPEVAHAKAGFVVEPQAEALAVAMQRLTENPRLRTEMGENARRLVAAKYTWDRIAEQMIRLYESILRQRNEPRTTPS